MSDYELLDKIVIVLDALEKYSQEDKKELSDIALDYLTNDELKLFMKYGLIK
jgi:hypothetical protein